MGVVVTQTMENYMANENDLQKDLSALRADIGALTETVGKLVSEAGKAQVAIRRTMKRGAKNAAGVGEEMWDEVVHLGHDTADAARDAGRAGMSSLVNEIKRNPLRAVVVVLCVGVIVRMFGQR